MTNERWTSKRIVEMLHRRYAGGSQGKDDEHYIRIEEARCGAGFSGTGGACDFLVIDTWPSRGFETIGHEIKVSLTDWQKEMKNPAKAERFFKHCHRWYAVMPDDLARKIQHELPPGWGLLACYASGQMRELVKPVKQKPTPIPASWYVGWMAQIDRQHKRSVPNLVRQGLEGAHEDFRQRVNAEVEARLAQITGRDAEIDERITALARATGIDLRRGYWEPDMLKLKQLWDLSRPGLGLEQIINHLTQATEKLAGALAAGEQP